MTEGHCGAAACRRRSQNPSGFSKSKSRRTSRFCVEAGTSARRWCSVVQSTRDFLTWLLPWLWRLELRGRRRQYKGPQLRVWRRDTMKLVRWLSLAMTGPPAAAPRFGRQSEGDASLGRVLACLVFEFAKTALGNHSRSSLTLSFPCTAVSGGSETRNPSAMAARCRRCRDTGTSNSSRA